MSFIIVFLAHFYCDKMTLGKRRAFSAFILSDTCSRVNVACDDDSGTSIEWLPHSDGSRISGGANPKAGGPIIWPKFAEK